jgi:hypothetical protein
MESHGTAVIDGDAPPNGARRERRLRIGGEARGAARAGDRFERRSPKTKSLCSLLLGSD